jgi:hypothetical protein
MYEEAPEKAHFGLSFQTKNVIIETPHCINRIKLKISRNPTTIEKKEFLRVLHGQRKIPYP